jgi:putative ABC transport system permease protein
MTSRIAIVDGRVIAEIDRRIDENVVSDGYVEALGMPLIAGRTLQSSDTASSPRVALVSDSAARKFWPAGNAIGGRYAGDVAAKPSDWITVVGIVGDIRRGLERAPDPMVYTSLAQNAWPLDFGPQYLFLRSTSLRADTAASRAATVIAETDPMMAVTSVQTVRDHVGSVAMPHRLGFMLFALFAGLAVVLTTFGVYAVVAYAIARRTREIGIRVALGAEAPGVLALVARQGLRPIAAGSIAGAAALWWFGDLLSRFLLSIPAFDAWALAAIASGVALVATLAMILPARHALAVDPVVALRTD